MNYYFFAASLPALSLDAPPPLTVDAFIALCREHLRADDAEAAEAVLSPDRDCRHPAVWAWRKREAAVRNAVVRARAHRTQRDPAPYLHEEAGCEVTIDAAVSSAFGAATPLEREQALDRLRWALADEAGGLVPFPAVAVMMYGVKLRLAARWAQMNDETGEAAASAVVDAAPAAAEPLAHR